MMASDPPSRVTTNIMLLVPLSPSGKGMGFAIDKLIVGTTRPSSSSRAGPRRQVVGRLPLGRRMVCGSQRDNSSLSLDERAMAFLFLDDLNWSKVTGFQI